MDSPDYIDSDGVTLTITPLDASTYYGTMPVVALGIRHPDEDPDPVLDIDVTNIEDVIARLRAAATAARNLHTCPDSQPCPAHDVPATRQVTA